MTATATASAIEPRSKLLASVTAFVAASAMILALGMYEFMVIPLGWDLNLTVDQANATNLIPTAVSLLVVFAASGMSDRFGYRRLLLAGSACYSIGALLVMAAGDFVMVVSGRALGGVGGAIMGVVGLAMVNTIFTDPRSRAKAFAAFAALIPAVSFIFPPLAALVAENWGWRFDPICWVALGLLTVFLTLVSVPSGYGSTGGGHELVTPTVAGVFLAGIALAVTVATSSVVLGGVLLLVACIAFVTLRLLRRRERYQGLDLRLLRSPGAWLVVTSIILLSGSSLYFFTSLFTQYRFNDPVIVIALLLSLPELAALVGCFVSGWAATRWGAPRTAAVAILIAGLTTVASLTVGPVTPLMQPVLVLCLVAGPSAAAIGPLTQTLMDLAPPDGSSAPAAMRDALQSLGSNLGGIIAGAVGLIAFGRYATGALIDAGLDPTRADEVAYAILDGTHVNDIAGQPGIPPNVADLIAGSRLILHTGQSVAYWGACLTAGIMLVVAGALMFRFARKHGGARLVPDVTR